MTRDPHSFARPEEARVEHLDLELTVDFEAQCVRGRASMKLARSAESRRVVLDTRDLEILDVTDGAGAALSFSLGAPDPLLGRALIVELPEEIREIAIRYATGKDAGALDWLSPEQTAGGSAPFLFTHGHAIETRSWIPTQDSPAVRQTYDALVTVPARLVALMSAARVDSRELPGAGLRTFAFRMAEPVPPHLIALAVGDLAFRATGPRTGVFAEPSVVERAAHEFGELEAMMDAAIALGGPYRWGRFDVLVMPPSFPYGGMENPRLAFVSASLLAGDRSLATVVAHELAHAWAGNLVTNATWNDFWLNEGITVYFELRMNEALWGVARADALRSYGARELGAEIKRQGASSPDTRLRYDMTGRDPVVGVTVIPYLKGAALLEAIEARVGRALFDGFLRDFFDRHAFRSITTAEFLDDVAFHLFGVDDYREAPMDFTHWVDDPGLPDGAPPRPSAEIETATASARAFLAGAAAASLVTTDWSPRAWRHFLGVLLDEAPCPRLAELDDAFGLSSIENAEVSFAWLRLAARCRHDAALPAMERFLRRQGRGKYLRPIYAELLSSSWGSEHARRIYEAARPRYHKVVRSALDPSMRRAP